MCRSIGLTDVPACGNNAEVLAHHGLDAGLDRSPRSRLTCIPRIVHWMDDVRRAETAARRSKSARRSTTAARQRRARRRRRCTRAVARPPRPPTVGRLPAPKRGEILGRAASLLRERTTSSARSSDGNRQTVEVPAAEVASSADLAVFMESEGSRFYGKTMTSPIAESVGADRSARRLACVRRSCRSTARWPGSHGKPFRRCSAATPLSRNRTRRRRTLRSCSDVCFMTPDCLRGCTRSCPGDRR